MKPLIHQIYAHNQLRNFNYLIECSDCFVAIDPYDADQVIDKINQVGKPLRFIINTHEHHDHIRGNDKLDAKFKPQILAHANALGMIPHLSRGLKAGDTIALDEGWNLDVLDTPGHTFSHLCLLLKQDDMVRAAFTGDTLFNAGVGNCHNGGDPKVLFQTIRDYFMTLSDDVIIYPGHDYLRNNLGFTLDREPGNAIAKDWFERHQTMDQEREFWQTCMKDERNINTFLRLEEKEIIQNLPKAAETPEDVFITLRELRNKW
ncbi:MAG: hydroxyacylglutathione hydrolase [Halobacteriovorax sp.]|nr:hydroxyacylglutathione hydrolase [Halobacteriovorax sp.]